MRDYEFDFYATHNATNKDYQGGDGAVEGGDPEWWCSYDRGDEGMAEAFWIQAIIDIRCLK